MKRIVRILVLLGFIAGGAFGYKLYLDDQIHSISFVTNEGNEINDIQVTYKDNIPELEIPVREGYFFAGWYTDSSKSELFNINVMPDEDITLFADWGSEDIIYTLFQGEYIVSAGTQMPVNVIIPKLYNGISVTKIAYQGFAFQQALASIYIPNTITEMGEGAFSNSSSLATVIFEEGSQVPSIPNNAFLMNYSLREIEIPASVVSIGTQAFYGSSLTSIIFEENSNLESIGSSAFFQLGGLNNIEFPKSLREIGYFAFAMCNTLETITFEENSQLESIGEAAFGGVSITSITFPTHLVTIGPSAFISTKLQVVSIPISVEIIGDNAFLGQYLTAIYAEAAAKPDGWSGNWNSTGVYVEWGSEE